MIQAVIFDCFGVIVTDALSVIVDEFSAHNPDGAQKIRNLVRAANRGILDPNESSEQVAEILGVSLQQYQQQVRSGEVKDTRVLDLIKHTRKSYKTALLSNISVPGLDRRFTEAEKTEYFDAVVVSAGIGYAKPEPEAYEITAARLDVRIEDCVFIDDREEYCEGARAVGMQAVWFQSFEQAKADLERILY